MNMSCKHTTDCATCTSIVAAATSELDGALAALDIYVANDDKCDQMLRSVGLDDTGNVVPRLHGLIKQHDEVLAILRDILAAETSGDVEALADLHVRARKLLRGAE
jgi:hypothetical protein